MELLNYNKNDIFWRDFADLAGSPYKLKTPLDNFKCLLVSFTRAGDYSRNDYPISLGYMASLIRMNRGKARILTSDIGDYHPGDFNGYDLVCIYPLTALWGKILETIKRIKQDTGSKICLFNSEQHQHEMILCAPQAKQFAGKLMDKFPEIDFALVGEAEFSFIRLCEKINKKENNFSSIPSLLYRQGEEVRASAAPISPVEFDFLPFPSRDYLEKTISEGVNTHSPRIQSSRGCVSPCLYCTESFTNITAGGRKAPVIQRDIIRFVDEIEMLSAKYKVVFFNVIDSSFEDPGQKGIGRINQFCDQIIKRGIKASFKIHFRAETAAGASDELLLKLKRAGVDILVLGVESGIKKELDSYRKIAGPEQSLASVKRMESFAGKFFIVLGHMMFSPVLILDDLPQKLDFLKKLNHTWDYLEMSNNVLIFPGTAYHEWIKQEGLVLEHDVLSPLIPYRFRDPRVKFVAQALSSLKLKCPSIIPLNMLFYEAGNLISRYYNKMNSHLWPKEEALENFRKEILRVQSEWGQILSAYSLEATELAKQEWSKEEAEAIYKKYFPRPVDNLLARTKSSLAALLHEFEQAQLSVKKVYFKPWLSLLYAVTDTSQGKIRTNN